MANDGARAGFHRAWGEAKGQKFYDKQAWIHVQPLLEHEFKAARAEEKKKIRLEDIGAICIPCGRGEFPTQDDHLNWLHHPNAAHVCKASTIHDLIKADEEV